MKTYKIELGFVVASTVCELISVYYRDYAAAVPWLLVSLLIVSSCKDRELLDQAIALSDASIKGWRDAVEIAKGFSSVNSAKP